MSQIKDPIPVTLITGFLGSGKTTLLSSLLKLDEMADAAVVINEFGEVGLDHDLIERRRDNIIELQNGCICCTIRGDLSQTLLELQIKMVQGMIPKFDRLLIETTGLADPVPIIHTLMASADLNLHYTLDGVIALVDAVNGEHTLNTQQESVKQAALAERIILTKTDLADEVTQASLTKRLNTINPPVTVIKSQFGEVPMSEILAHGSYYPANKTEEVKAWLAAETYEQGHEHHQHDHDNGHSHDHHIDHEHGHGHDHHHHDVNRHGSHIQAFSLTSSKPIKKEDFSTFLQLLNDQLGPDMLRVKGIINVEGEPRPAVVHGVQHIFHKVRWLDQWPDDDTRTRLVFITRNIKKEQVEELFESLKA